MNKRIFDVGSVVGLVALIAFGVFAVAGGLGDSETKAADQAREASCLAGAESCDDAGGGAALGVCDLDPPDCVDTIVNPNGDEPICIAPEEGGDVACNDTPAGDGLNQVCTSDQPECVDTGGSDGFGGTDPGTGSSSSPGYAGCADVDCKQKAVDAAWALLDNDGVSGEITLAGAKAVEWPNSCLGVTSADTVCAEVITPGFVVTLQRNGSTYIFNTDTNGHAVSAAN